MAVTQEDGGRLNAFATEPRMRYVDPPSAGATSGRLLWIGVGVGVVVAMVAVAIRIS
ncbi:MAG: ssl1498 family light-harvesting-like protein [Synechococcaceae bacterium WB6_3B_236]|jgi:hypothetical protein|nr:ssl1498 family light-harvesting-like protein [Synechococcaceae bacterium WB6_3B_236]